MERAAGGVLLGSFGNLYLCTLTLIPIMAAWEWDIFSKAKLREALIEGRKVLFINSGISRVLTEVARSEALVPRYVDVAMQTDEASEIDDSFVTVHGDRVDILT